MRGSGVSPPTLWLSGFWVPWECVLAQPGSSAEVPFILLPAFCWMPLVFPVLLVGFVMPVLVVVVSAHPV